MPQRPPREGAQFLAIGQSRLQPLRDLGRIEDQRQELLELRRFHSLLKQAFDQWSQRSRSIVDDVSQLFVFTVNVTDDVYGPLREREYRRQPRDLSECRIDVRELPSQRPEERQFVTSRFNISDRIHGNSGSRSRNMESVPCCGGHRHVPRV